MEHRQEEEEQIREDYKTTRTKQRSRPSLEEVAQFKLNTHGQLADNRRGSFVLTLAASIGGRAAAAGLGIAPGGVCIAGMTQLQCLRLIDKLQCGRVVVVAANAASSSSRQLAKAQVQAVPPSCLAMCRVTR